MNKTFSETTIIYFYLVTALVLNLNESGIGSHEIFHFFFFFFNAGWRRLLKNFSNNLILPKKKKKLGLGWLLFKEHEKQLKS